MAPVEVVARVERIAPLAAGGFEVQLGLGAETTGFEAGQLMNMLFGNCSLQPDVSLEGVVFPDGYASAFARPAFGIEGGKDGAPGELRINGVKTDPKRQYVLKRGDTVSLGTPGGGGHGDPKQRDRAALAADETAGYVTDPTVYEVAAD